MPITIDRLHDDIRSSLRKYNSAFVSPVDIDIAANKAQHDVLDRIILEYESGQERSSADQGLLFLHPFSGAATERALPSNLYKISTVFDGDYEGDILDDRHFNDRLKSFIIPPSSTRPIATVFNDGAAKIRIEPSSTTHKIKYWKMPTDVKYNFTVVDGDIVFSLAGSVNFEFPMSEYTRILNRTLFYLGMPSVNSDAANLEKQAQ